MLYSIVLFWKTLSDLEWLSEMFSGMKHHVARCNSWASCTDYHCICPRIRRIAAVAVAASATAAAATTTANIKESYLELLACLWFSSWQLPTKCDFWWKALLGALQYAGRPSCGQGSPLQHVAFLACLFTLAICLSIFFWDFILWSAAWWRSSQSSGWPLSGLVPLNSTSLPLLCFGQWIWDS